MGGVAQMRILGGVIGVAAATNLLNNTLQSSLSGSLPAETITALLENISFTQSLPLNQQDLVQTAFLGVYRMQFAMMLGFAAAEVLALALMWERVPRRLP